MTQYLNDMPKIGIFPLVFALLAGGYGVSVNADTSDDSSCVRSTIFPQPASPGFSFAMLGAEADKNGISGSIVRVTGTGAHLTAQMQDLEAEVSSDGLWIISTSHEDAGRQNRLRIKASSVGRLSESGRFFPSYDLPAEGTVRTYKESVFWLRSGMVEEYRVSTDGVRQDYVVLQRPTGSGDALVVNLELEGAGAEATDYGARLSVGATGRELAYSRLQVTDATGRELSARLEVPCPDRLRVVVEDAGAAYPVRIDPTFSDADWVALNTEIAGANGPVNAFAVDGNGNIYAGGWFSAIGTVEANRIAKWDGNAWSALDSGMTGELSGGSVTALAVIGSDLYAGGYFTTAGGTAANYVAKWNGSDWSALDSGMNSQVRALVVIGSDLYAGGSFTTAGGMTARGVAKWDGSDWSALGSGVHGDVDALAVAGSDIYAAGLFSRAGGTDANMVARWDGNTWFALGSGMNSRVTALVVGESILYAGGTFTTAGGTNANYVAKWDGITWSALGSGLTRARSAVVPKLVLIGSELYVGGNFDRAGTKTVNHIAKWNGSEWSPLGAGTDDDVSALAAIGSDLYVGGTFRKAGEVGASGIAKWDGTTWSKFGTGLNGDIYALAVSGSELYMGGDFTSVGEVDANYVAKWDGSSWSNLGSGVSGGVRALAVIGNDVYAGGLFNTVTGIEPNYIAKWNGSTWSALGTYVRDEVFALAVDGSDLYVGGFFFVAKWNGRAWSSLGSGMGDKVSALVVSGGNLYAGGFFRNAGGTEANYIAKWNGGSWSALGSGMNNGVTALAVRGSDLYAGGYFTTAGGTGANHIARWDGTAWSALGSGVNGDVSGLAVIGRGVYAGGNFTTAGGTEAKRIAKWNGNTWSPLTAGMNDRVNALSTDSSGHLFVGGRFQTAGTTFSPFLARASVGAAPIVTTMPADAITENSATLGGEVEDDGDVVVNVRGVVIDTSPLPVLAAAVDFPATTAGVGMFTVDAAGLTPGTRYYSRAYAINNVGTSYGEEIVFTTASPVVFAGGTAEFDRSIFPGDRHVFNFTLDRPRVVRISTTGGASLTIGLRDSEGRIIASFMGDGEVIFDELLLATSYVLEIQRQPGTGSALAYQLEIDARVEAVTRPDVAVGPSAARLVGRLAYPPSRQTATVLSLKARPVTAALALANRGNRPDRLLLRGRNGEPFLKVTYFGPTGNITSAVVTGTYRTPEIDESDAEILVRVSVKPNVGKLVGKTGQRTAILKKVLTLPVSAKSTKDATKSDSGAIQILVR